MSFGISSSVSLKEIYCKNNTGRVYDAQLVLICNQQLHKKKQFYVFLLTFDEAVAETTQIFSPQEDKHLVSLWFY